MSEEASKQSLKNGLTVYEAPIKVLGNVGGEVVSAPGMIGNKEITGQVNRILAAHPDIAIPNAVQFNANDEKDNNHRGNLLVIRFE